MRRIGKPGAATPEDTVRATVLSRLLRGEALDLASLAAEVGVDPPMVADTLANLNASGAIYVRDGTVIAAYPLSAAPTRHRVRLEGTIVYACCAIDALAVPAMADGAATIESRCSYCDAVVTVEMADDRVIASRPGSPVVFHVARECCEAGPVVLTRCPQINFFCHADHLRRWRSEHPRLAGDTLTLAQAVPRAREIFGSTIDLVRGGTGKRRHVES